MVEAHPFTLLLIWMLSFVAHSLLLPFYLSYSALLAAFFC
jgi:hypothetical protein